MSSTRLRYSADRLRIPTILSSSGVLEPEIALTTLAFDASLFLGAFAALPEEFGVRIRILGGLTSRPRLVLGVRGVARATVTGPAGTSPNPGTDGSARNEPGQ